MSNGQTITDGLNFAESPRWHNGELWFSDVHGQTVHRMALDGEPAEVVRFHDDLPSGLGWLPDGRLLVVAMDTQQVRRLDDDGTVCVHADLSRIATGTVNDMVVASDGTAYVGDTGFRLWAAELDFAPGRLVVLAPDGAVTCVVEDLMAPNGIALSADGRTLVVAESAGPRLIAFDVAADGMLAGRRTFADLSTAAPVAPDGICLDEEGAVWVADPIGQKVLRVLEGGEITENLTFDELPAACVLVGDDRRTLAVCLAPHWDRTSALAAPLSHLDAFQVAIPGAGRP